MAGVTDRPFRQLCKKFGAGMAVPAGIVCIVAYAISPKHGIYEGQRHGSTKDLRATAVQPHHS